MHTTCMKISTELIRRTHLAEKEPNSKISKAVLELTKTNEWVKLRESNSKTGISVEKRLEVLMKMLEMLNKSVENIRPENLKLH